MANANCLLYLPGQNPAEIPFDAVSEHIDDENCFVWIDMADAECCWGYPCISVDPQPEAGRCDDGLDNDRDGLTDHEEYLTGTDPWDNASFFKAELTINPVSGETYGPNSLGLISEVVKAFDAGAKRI